MPQNDIAAELKLCRLESEVLRLLRSKSNQSLHRDDRDHAVPKHAAPRVKEQCSGPEEGNREDWLLNSNIDRWVQKFETVLKPDIPYHLPVTRRTRNQLCQV